MELRSIIKVYQSHMQMKKSQLDKLMISYIDSVSQKVDSRIASEPVLEAFSVLEPQSIESLTEEERMSYLNQLSEKYVSDIDTLKREYSGLKYLMTGSYRNIKFQSFCHRILTRHAEDYQEITRLKLLCAFQCQVLRVSEDLASRTRLKLRPELL